MDEQLDRLDAQAEALIDRTEKIMDIFDHLIDKTRENAISETRSHLKTVLNQMKSAGQLDETTRLRILSAFPQNPPVSKQEQIPKRKKDIKDIQWN